VAPDPTGGETPPVRPGVAWTPLTGAAHRIAVAVLLDGPLPRSELARRFDLSPGSLTRLSRPLLDSGLLVETTGAYDATSGRPTRPLDVDESSHHFVGVKLTATTAHAVLTTLRARVVAAEEALLPDTSPAAVAAVVAGLVRTLAASVSDTGVDGVRAVGVSLGWDDVPLGDALEELLGLPVVVDNDLLSLTRAEQWFGAARRCDHFAVLTIGEGVGYGLVVHDEVVDSPDAGVGLLGHFPLEPGGPLCPQGHAGCADSLLTISAVTQRACVGLRRTVRYEDVLDLALAGDPVARRVVDEAARGLGRLVAAVGNLTMPKKIILSGDGIRLAEVGREALVAQVAADRHPLASPLDVDVQQTGFREWARGAAVTAIRTFVLGTRA
jgi:predicted NBD/HSP70 family sugar kinase